MASSTGGPQVQFEAMLKVLFADAATKDEVLAVVDAIGEWAAITRASGEAIAADYLDGEPPYPDRAHIVALTMGYQIAFVQAVQDWVAWARDQIERWDGTGAQPTVDLAVFEQVVAVQNPVAGDHQQPA
jgi:hypothetical protein